MGDRVGHIPKVMIHPADYGDCRQAVARAFEVFPVSITDKKVFIKPNALRTSRAEEGIVTHPAVLKAVVETVEAMKPSSIAVGDNPGLFSYGANEACFEKTGLMDAAKGHYENIGNASKIVDFNPNFVPAVSLSQAILDADIIISLPKFKTHGLTVMSGAIKNSYGFLPGAQKARLHKIAGSPERFHEVIVEVFRLRIPDMIIMDAVVGMEGNGPASPDLRDIGLILASTDAVALDVVVAKMMGLEPNRLRFLQKAMELGLGDLNFDRINIIGNFGVLPAFKLPPLGGETISDNQAIQDTIHGKAQVKPLADPALCTACGTCMDQCPVCALSMDDQLPVADPDLCIACFCCQEICPEKAITLH